jgi:hypothetical protein
MRIGTGGSSNAIEIAVVLGIGARVSAVAGKNTGAGSNRLAWRDAAKDAVAGAAVEASLVSRGGEIAVENVFSVVVLRSKNAVGAGKNTGAGSNRFAVAAVGASLGYKIRKPRSNAWEEIAKSWSWRLAVVGIPAVPVIGGAAAIVGSKQGEAAAIASGEVPWVSKTIALERALGADTARRRSLNPLVDATRGGALEGDRTAESSPRRRAAASTSAVADKNTGAWRRSLEAGSAEASSSRRVAASAAASSSTTAAAAEGGRSKSSAIVEATRSKKRSSNGERNTVVAAGKHTGAAAAVAAEEGAEEGRIEVTGCYHDELVF